MTTINPATSFGQTQGITGQSYVFLQAQLLMALMDMIDPIVLGLARLKGDLAGSGSDVLRVAHVDNIGYARRFTATASETSPVSASPFDLGYSTVSIGEYALAHEETYKHQALNSQPGISLDALIALVPNSWIATIRELVCNAGAGISTAVGAAGTQLSVDNILALRAAARNADAYGRLIGMVSPQQVDQLLQSVRSEPAFQGMASDFLAAQGQAVVNPVLANILGQQIDLGISNDIDQSGGAYQGFALSEGGMGYAIANTSRITPANQDNAIYVPEYGLLIEQLTDGSRQRTRAYQAIAYLGVAVGSSDVFFQRRLISAV